MSAIISKCGIHSIGDDRHGYGPFTQRIAAAGRQLSLIKCRDSFGAIDEPLALWPDIVTIGAFTEFDRLPFDFAAFEKRALLNPRIKYWEVLNEEDSPSTYAAKADLYISLAPLFKEHGWGMCMFNCSSGTPPYPFEDGNVSYAEISRACKYMIDNGYDAILGLHEYHTPSNTIGRYQVLADYLSNESALLPIAVTEWGFETNPGNDLYMAFVQQSDPIYMVDPHVIGCALWTLGGSGWGAANYDTMLPQLGEYIATVDPVAIDPIELWEHDYWDVDGRRVDGNPLHLVMDRAHVVTPHARKKLMQYPLTLNPCPEDADLVVRVDPADMIYPAGSTVTLEAIA